MKTILIFFILTFNYSAQKSDYGIVETYNAKLRQGTIIRNSDGKEIYFHKDDCIDEVRVLDPVQFKTKNGSKGFYAIDVEIFRID